MRQIDHQLFKAAALGDVRAMEAALAQGANPAARIKDGVNAFYTTIFHNKPDATRALIAAGADIEQVFSTKTTPLCFAAWLGCMEIVTILLDAGAEIDAPEPLEGTTALWWAAYGRQPEIVELLLSRGASVDTRCASMGSTPLICAIQHRETRRVVPLLVERTRDVNAVDGASTSPLMAAVSSGDLAIIELLLNAGADPNFGNENDRPLDYFMFGPVGEMTTDHMEKIIALLRARGAKRSDEIVN